MKGIRRKNPLRVPRTPSGEEFLLLEKKIIRGKFPDEKERLVALSVLRSISRYNSGTARVAFEKLSDKSKAELTRILDEAGLELDFE